MTMDAPAAAYSASGIDESSPAPVSTSTWWPWATSSRAPSGVRATRCSPFFVSAGTPTIIDWRTGRGSSMTTTGAWRVVEYTRWPWPSHLWATLANWSGKLMTSAGESS